MSTLKQERTTELSIAVKGEIISSNFDAYKEYAIAQIQSINLDLKTDEDFEQAAKDVKGLKAFEDRLKQAEVDFLSQMDEVDALLKNIRDLGGLSRETRLNAEKRINARKAEVRDGIIRDGIAALVIRNREFSDMIGDAIKGKSSLTKMQEAVTVVVESVNARIRANLEVFAKASDEHGDAVAYGKDTFCALTVEAAKVEMERRIERHRASLKEAELKAERDRLQREANDRAKQEAAEKAAQTISTPLERTPEAVATVEPSGVGASLQSSDDALPPKAKASQSASEEMECFISVLSAAFAPAKEARASLKHPENIKLAAAFAESLGTAFRALKGGVK